MRIRAIALGLALLVVAACAAFGPERSATDTSTPSPTATTAVLPSPTATTAVSPSPNPTSAPSVTPGSSCPPPATVKVLGGWTAAWPSDQLADCFGNADLEVTGYLAPAWELGGVSNGVVPSWLGEWSGLMEVLWLKPHPADGCYADDDCIWLFLFAPDASVLPLTPDRWVSVTGHFDDPVAQTCRAPAQGPDIITTDAQAIAECRKHFVITQIRTIAPPAG